MRSDRSAQRLLFDPGEECAPIPDLYPARRVILSSASEHWCTPPEVLAVIRAFAAIVFDPFSNKHSLVGAALDVRPPDDSLIIDWPAEGLIYCNPPYGDQLGPCAAKIGAEGSRGREIISLVPARTDTAWWQKGIAPALWCAWEGRMTFLEPIETLEARHADRVNRAKAMGLKPPKPLRYERVGNLARGETATFPSALCYTGPRPERFRLIFGRYGRIYHELTAPQALRLGLIH